jgi:hemoglobin/transferrin/lactoferrin receptor protein
MGKNRLHGFEDWGKVFEYSENSNDFYSATATLNPDENLQQNTGLQSNRFITEVFHSFNNKYRFKT